MVTTAVLLGLCLLGLVVAATSLLALARPVAAEPWPHTLLALVLVVGGVSYHSEFTPLRPLLQVAIVVGCLAAAVLLVVGPTSWRRPMDRRRTGAALLLLASWAVMFAVNTTLNYTLGPGPLLGRLAPGLVLLAVLVVWMLGGLSRRVLTLSLTTALGLVAAGLPLLQTPFRPCDQFKCGVLGELLIGPFSSENYLAMLAAFGLVLLVRADVGAVRRPGILLCVTLLLATGGRTSQIAAVLGILAMAVTTLLTRRGGERRLARGTSWALPVAGGAAGLWIVYSASGSELSNRGGIWVRAREALVGHEVFGLGISRWSGYDHLSAISHHFPHNVYLLTMFSGGAVALVLLLLAVGQGIRAAGAARQDLRATIGYSTTLLVLGSAEIVTNLMTVDGLTWALLPVLAAGSWQAAEQPRRSHGRGTRALDADRVRAPRTPAPTARRVVRRPLSPAGALR